MTRKKAKADIGAKLEEVAVSLADDLLGLSPKPDDDEARIPFPDKVNGFKALVGYYAMISKLEAPDDGDGAGKFGGWSEKINGQQTASARARGRGTVTSTLSEPEF